MKRQLTTGTHSMLIGQIGGVVCHVARAAELIFTLYATGKTLMIRHLIRGRNYSIGGGGRRWRSGQYRLHSVLRLG